MKNKLDWSDDNWNWDVRPTRVLYELLLSPTYRIPMRVKVVCSYEWGTEFPRCPRCRTTMEHEYQLFCDRCGQRLNWSGFDNCEVKYIGGTDLKMTRTRSLTLVVNKWMMTIKKIPLG